MAPLLHIINFNNLYFRVENETTLISAKNRVNLSSISEVRSYITEWPRFFGPPCMYMTINISKNMNVYGSAAGRCEWKCLTSLKLVRLQTFLESYVAALNQVFSSFYHTVSQKTVPLLFWE